MYSIQCCRIHRRAMHAQSHREPETREERVEYSVHKTILCRIHRRAMHAQSHREPERRDRVEYGVQYNILCRIHCRAMHCTLTENPLETRVENTAYSKIQSVEYSIKYTRQTDVTQHVNQLDNSWIPRGPQPKGQGPWPLASRTWAGSQSSPHVRKSIRWGFCPEATIGRSWPLATTTWAGYGTLYTMWSKSDRPYFQQRPQSKGQGHVF